MHNFQAFRIHDEGGKTRAGIETINLSELSSGDVVIEAHYSSVNYKDALAGTGRGKILHRSPLIGGIDVSGVVASSEDKRFKAGDAVLVTGCGLSEVHDGGYAEYVRVPADWVIPLPQALDPFRAMAIGTAGFTAALAIKRLQENHQSPELGPILVTGATGGVGSFAIDMLSTLGFEVVALSGKSEAVPYLTSLGASRIVNRHNLEMGTQPLEKTQWGGAMDNVGGDILAWLTRTVSPWGNIVSIGLAGGVKLETTVMPFILRGVGLLGVSSSNCPLPWREPLWQRLGSDLKPRHLDKIASETVTLQQLPDVFERMLAGQTRGRVVVSLRD
ncbi:MAG TPA: oxidoreductase [Gammaproteobacteria bacterium]|nr:oxidoreductase [Gammaproteobacteria bacterium]